MHQFTNEDAHLLVPVVVHSLELLRNWQRGNHSHLFLSYRVLVTQIELESLRFLHPLQLLLYLTHATPALVTTPFLLELFRPPLLLKFLSLVRVALRYADLHVLAPTPSLVTKFHFNAFEHRQQSEELL